MEIREFSARVPARRLARELTREELKTVAGGCEPSTYDSDPRGSGREDYKQCDVKFQVETNN